MILFKIAAALFSLGWLAAFWVIFSAVAYGADSVVFRVGAVVGIALMASSLLFLVVAAVKRYLEDRTWRKLRKELEAYYEDEILP